MKFRYIYGYRFCILPEGNRSEFIELDNELLLRKVRASYWEFGGGRIYRISVKELYKLPGYPAADGRVAAPYLGDDDSGHSIYKMSQQGLDSFGKKQKWVDI